MNRYATASAAPGNKSDPNGIWQINCMGSFARFDTGQKEPGNPYGSPPNLRETPSFSVQGANSIEARFGIAQAQQYGWDKVMGVKTKTVNQAFWE